ncbi:hypothetical protein Tco_0173175, partial [Tanacetum coccineum]
KPCLIRWILLLQEFNIEIKDKKGAENVNADHLSRIENDETSDDSDVDDNFPGETLMKITTKDEPWFVDFANYLVADVIPKGMTYQQKKNSSPTLKTTFGKILIFSKYVQTVIDEEDEGNRYMVLRGNDCSYASFLSGTSNFLSLRSTKNFGAKAKFLSEASNGCGLERIPHSEVSTLGSEEMPTWCDNVGMRRRKEIDVKFKQGYGRRCAYGLAKYVDVQLATFS